jgi:hypothetical protein
MRIAYGSSFSRQHFGRLAAADDDALPDALGLLPIVLLPAEPLADGELPDAMLPLGACVALGDEPVVVALPVAAVFSFGWPVAASRQWVAAEIEPDGLDADGDDGLDCAAAITTPAPSKAALSNNVLVFSMRESP